MKLGRIYSLILGFVYALHSIGFPVLGVAIKPYQVVAIIFSYKGRAKKVIVGVAAFMLVHALVVYLYNGTLTFDASAYIFIGMILIYSYLLLRDLKASFETVVFANTLVYISGIVVYAYCIYTGTYVNIHSDISERADLVNTLSSLVFFDGTRIRYNGFALDPNFYAFYVNIFLGVALCLAAIHDFKVPRIFIIVSIISVVLTLSRAGVLCLFLLLLASGWSGSGYSKKTLVVAMAALGAAVLALLSVYLGRSVFDYGDIADSRLWVWYSHLDNALQSGVGYIGNGITFDVVRYLNEGVFHKSTHNTVLYLVYCFGLGLTVLLVSLWLLRLVRLLLCGLTETSVLLIALHLVYAVSLLTLDLIFTVPFYLYIVFCYMYPPRFGKSL
ncbi:hypothetical protein [Thalassolituus sp. UBA3500]|uniref:hypothetical protein n=1 Tax=Thalassolituus sp. UBA3500 TaxID=1947664 RepID=UPI0007D02341|nr:hypothetical protein [Thalassolituus sp. UBA3500]KZZ12875.1 hypothetical protein A3746_01825 [Oleibacter sp. HI0075]MBN59270.1 hypothetical protein [Oceanospirillaceae bacterium]|tara:strand:- start:10339 stop:11496 length:1158 start_codon:yes stop_codon:yes gene_type:complete